MALTGYTTHPLYFWHDTGTNAGLLPADPAIGLQPFHHFENADTKRRIHELIQVSGLAQRLTHIPPRPARESEILRVHTREYVDRIRAESQHPKGGDCGDGVSPFGKGGYDIGLLAAGGVIEAALAVHRREVTNAYALVRPPGHHALPDTGMGFCMFNNIAVAAHALRAEDPDIRIAVVDWDVHHGNGTQAIFYNDPTVLVISLHQYNVFPIGSGMVEERGDGPGFGYTLNVPLPAGSQRAAYLYAMDRVVEPALRRFCPDIILVASGFDGNVMDPLSWVAISADTYRDMTTRLMGTADEVCAGRIAMAHEGGYAPTYVPYCGLAVLEALSGHYTGIEDPLRVFTDTWMAAPLTDSEKAVVDQVATLVSDIDPRSN